ncbi:MAG: ABC transporter ATP-binding protein [Bacteroidetes bacterium]|nr:ABC transporter ATP-binding protein [Bacteroidota bacterium]
MILSVENISKSYGPHAVLHDVSLAVAERETLAILGRSGCGKTTLLKIVAGLVDADAGSLCLRGAAIGDTPIERRNVVYIYQEPLLFPHLTVFENIAFGLRLRRKPAAEVERAVATMMDELELAGHGAKLPSQLSGGQRQRVAFGRAIIVKPDVLLLDEPFSSLDTETRASMQALFRSLVRAHGVASIFVTHDLKEAILIGDAIAYMQEGRLVTFGTKAEFIAHPEFGARREIEFWASLGGDPMLNGEASDGRTNDE